MSSINSTFWVYQYMMWVWNKKMLATEWSMIFTTFGYSNIFVYFCVYIYSGRSPPYMIEDVVRLFSSDGGHGRWVDYFFKIAGRTHGSIHNMFLENHVSTTRPCFWFWCRFARMAENRACFWMQGVLSLVIPLLFWWMIYGTSAGRLEQSEQRSFLLVDEL